MNPDPVDPGVGPLAEVLGIRRGAMSAGRCVFETTVRPAHMNPHGVVHGGVIYTLVDYAMGGALTSLLERGERCATIEVKIQYVRPVEQGSVRAEAHVVTRTRRIGVLEARVHGGEDLVALATGTFYIQSPEPRGDPS